MSRALHSAAPCARWLLTTALLVDYSYYAIPRILHTTAATRVLSCAAASASLRSSSVLCAAASSLHIGRAVSICVRSLLVRLDFVPRTRSLSLSPLHFAIFLCGVSFFAHFKYTTSTILYSPHHNMMR